MKFKEQIKKMDSIKKTKSQLIEELKVIRKKNIDLETAKIKYNVIQKELDQSHKKLSDIMEGIAQIITEVIEIRDPHFIGHQRRVSKLATAIAKEMKMTEGKIEGIKFAALVYDLGKVNVPTEITNKSSKLAEVEYSRMKNHAKISYDIFKKVDFPWPIAEIVFQHHERLDGSGYPRGLKSDEILMEAKIIAVADVVDAMSSKRAYRPAYSIKEALEEISKNKGILYEPEAVDACLKLFKEKSFKFR